MNTEEFLLLPFQEVNGRNVTWSTKIQFKVEVLISSSHLNIEKEQLVFKVKVYIPLSSIFNSFENTNLDLFNFTPLIVAGHDSLDKA